MKTLFTLMLLMLIIVAGTISFEFFAKSIYGKSALLTLIAILSLDFCVYLMSNKRARA
ncbi:MAG TPA: hypothetical protein VKR32_14370 [Puia sp.]|nr:hypothetical protein [Puia sp.]